METLKRKQPAFYEALKQAMRIDASPSARATDTPAPSRLSPPPPLPNGCERSKRSPGCASGRGFF